MEVAAHHEDVATLIGLARSDWREERRLAARALGALRRPEAGPVLVELLEQDEDETLATDAANALRKLGWPGAVDPLRRAARGPGFIVRKAALNALGIVGDPAAAADLEIVTGDPISRLRAAAVRALGRIGTEECVDPVARCLSDPSATSGRRRAGR